MYGRLCYPHADSEPLADAEPNTNGHVDSEPDANSYSDGNPYRDRYGDNYSDTDGHGHAYGDTHSDADGYGHAYGDTNSDTDGYRHAYGDTHSAPRSCGRARGRRDHMPGQLPEHREPISGRRRQRSGRRCLRSLSCDGSWRRRGRKWLFQRPGRQRRRRHLQPGSAVRRPGELPGPG